MPHAEALQENFSRASLSRGASFAIVVDSYQNGVALSVHSLSVDSAAEISEFAEVGDPFFLRTRDCKEIGLPAGKFYIYRDNVAAKIEACFAKLAKNGVLAKATVYVGVNTDPFHVFHTKFANTMACMDMLDRYPTARVVVQSRSKMLLTALPLLKKMGARGIAVVPLETHSDAALSRYLPGQPEVKERLKTAVGLSAQGIPICFSVNPLLPYGNTRGDLWKFAEMLIQFSDMVSIGALCDGSKHRETQVKKTRLAAKLESDEELELLRPSAALPLEEVLAKLSPEHLKIPPVLPLSGEQLKLFAA